MGGESSSLSLVFTSEISKTMKLKVEGDTSGQMVVCMKAHGLETG